MPLAQVDPTSAIAGGLAANPLAWGLALALVAIAYLFKTLSEERKNAAVELASLRDKQVEQLKQDAKEQREILSQIVPLAAKLVDGLEVLERLTDSIPEEKK
jgi:hypothetical protein